MDVTGEYLFDAPVARVWDTLLNPESLARCMPGCEELKPLGNDQYEATMNVGVGPIQGTYSGRVTIADQAPMQSFTLLVEGSESPSFVRGKALITLEEQGGKTLVKVKGDAQIGGTMAGIGQLLMGSVNKMMMDRLFTCLQEEVTR